MAKLYLPTPFFDTLRETLKLYKTIYENDHPRVAIKRWLNHCLKAHPNDLPSFAVKDYQAALQFLYTYRGSQQTFNAYRRDIERLVQWSWFVKKQSLLRHKRDDIEAFVEFCIKPYKRWINTKKVARFKCKEGHKLPNREW